VKLVTSVEPVDGPSIPKGLALTTVVGEYETRFKHYREYAERGRNVILAAEKLNGAIIPPRDVLSFNKEVGPRTGGRGFRLAPVIHRGELVDGMGGGVCQVASTLHAAALHAGLEVVGHTPHSRASSYIRAGFDATVVWPDVDLVIRNPYDFPMVVRTSTAGGRLKVELLAERQPAEVTVEREVLEERLFTRRFVPDPQLAPGSRVVAQKGTMGYRVRVRRTVRIGDETRREDREVLYHPADAIIRIPG
jgi:vancomycin resistance protein YoaR